MRAVRLHDVQDVRFDQVDDAPDPVGEEVRVKVAYAGICGSDIHNFRTGQWISRKPAIAGHEFSGWVASVGEDVTDLKPGDKVVADSRYYCGTCAACLRGDHHLCENLGFVGEVVEGGFADFVILPQRLVLKTKPDMALDAAALAEPLAVALHALNRVNCPDDAPLFVVGCGPIGALVAMASSLTSKRELIICDQNQSRAEIVAKATGAEIGGLGELEHLGVHHAIDTTGNVGVIADLMAKLTGGTIGLVGIGEGTVTFDPVEAVEREIAVIGCHVFKDELPIAVDMLGRHSAAFEPLIQHQVGLEQVPTTYLNMLAARAKGIKTLIQICPEK